MAAGRGRKWGVALGVTVVVLAGLLLAADRIGAYAAERTIAKQAKQQLAARDVQMPSDPKVSVGGFPFLTQVLRGKYDKVTIDMTKPTIQGITLNELDIAATGVNASTNAVMRGQGQVTADHVDGTARLAWDQVPKLLDQAGISANGMTVSANDAGQLVVREPLTLQGNTITVTAIGTLSVVEGAVKIKMSNVQVEGASVPPLVQRLAVAAAGRLGGNIKLPKLPYNMQIQSVKTESAALTVTAFANNVPITG
jgi:hypothetical protein